MPRESEAPGRPAGGNRRATRRSQRPGESSRRAVFSQSGRVVGTLAGQVLRKAVDASRHFLRTPPAIAWDLTALEEARQHGVTQCEVRDRESSRVYTARLEEFFTKGFAMDRGFGRQLALPLAYWRASEPGESLARQLSMFEEVPA